MKSGLPARFVVCAAVAASLLGCGVRAGQLAPTPWPLPEEGSKPSVTLAVAVVSVTMDGTPRDASLDAVSRWTGRIRGTYLDSRLFSGVLDVGNPAELRAEVRISESVQRNALWDLLSRATAFVIPSRTNSRLTMQTAFKDSGGDVLLSIEKSELVGVWVQLLLAPALPFGHAARVADDTVRDLARATLAEAQAKGVL